jgi:hypothetical protein
LSVLVDAEAYVPGTDTCRVTVPSTFSCQKEAFEKPDEKTAASMREKGTQALIEKGCDPTDMKMSFRTILVGAQDMEYSGAKLASLGMASNCYRAGNDPNHATHTIRAECTNQYEMTTSDGERIKNTNKRFLSNLAVCDVSDDVMPQLMEDARKVAVYNAGQNGFVADRDKDFACTFSILPHF